jgi:putative membrane protein
MKIAYSLIPGILIGLAGCGCGNNASMVGDPAAGNTKDKPVSQVDTGAKKNVTYMAGSEMDSTASSRSSALDPKDARFLQDAYRGGLLEVALGRIAQSKAADAAVRDYGAMMVHDHGQGGNALRALAASRQLTLPDSISDDQKRERDRLLNEDNAVFDKDYIHEMVQDHKNDIVDFKTESISGQDSSVKSFAAQMLKMLNMHLDRAQNIQSKIH